MNMHRLCYPFIVILFSVFATHAKAEVSWSVPRQIVRADDIYVGTMTSDASGKGHLVYWELDSSGGTVRLRYLSSVSSPITLVEYELCAYPCQPGQISDWQDSAIACDTLGRLHVAYAVQYEGNCKIMYMYRDGSNWSTPVPIVEGNSLFVDAITCDSDNNWHLVYEEFDDVNQVMRIRYMSGISNPTSLVEYHYCSYPCEPGQVLDLGGATLARDPSGRLHVAYAVEYEANCKIMYMYSDGSKWSTPVPIVEGNSLFVDAMTCDSDNNWHLVYDEFDDVNQVMRYRYMSSISNPTSLVEYHYCSYPCQPGQVSDPDDAAIAWAPDGRLHVVYGVELEEEGDRMMYLYSRAGLSTQGWFGRVKAMPWIPLLLLNE
jgi:hypothetical protein